MLDTFVGGIEICGPRFLNPVTGIPLEDCLVRGVRLGEGFEGVKGDYGRALAKPPKRDL